jgi:hypothetical protein
MGDLDTTQQELDDPEAIAPDGGEFTLTAQDFADLISGAQDFLQAQTAVQDRILGAENGIFGANSGLEQEMWTSVLNAMQADQLPYTEVQPFFNWLRTTQQMVSIPPDLVAGDGFNQLLAQYATQQLGLVIPAYVPAGPPELPSPSIGQKTVAKGAREVKPSVVTAPTLSTEQAAAIQAAIGVASADILKVQAAVIDAMLPNLQPGQVTQALDQLNRAMNAIENQMTGVLTTLNRNATGSLAAQVNGALEALHGLSQEVGILAQDVAMKAESTIGDDVNTNTAGIAALSATVGTVVGTTIPALEGQLGALNGQVNNLSDTVTNEVEPKLSQVTEQTAANTDTLSGTDKECLDQLCDAEGNVINPIKEGGATPSLLKGLGNLLTKGIELGILAGLVDTLVAVFDGQLAVSAVVQDTETISKWAAQSVAVVTSDPSWRGPL